MIKKLLGIFLVFTGIVSILLAVLILGSSILFPKTKIIDITSRRVKTYLNREITIDKLSFSVLSGLKFHGVRLSNHPDFSKGVFFEVKNAEAGLDLQKFFKYREIYGFVTIDSIYFDIREKESILESIAKKPGRYLEKRNFLICYSFLPFPVSSVTFKFNAGKMHFVQGKYAINPDFDGVIDVKLNSSVKRITFTDIIVKDDKGHLKISGYLDNFYDPKDLSYALNIKGDRDLFDRLIKFVASSDLSYKPGKTAFVDIEITGNTRGIKISSNESGPAGLRL
ncbi:MAG: hypothetical protein LHV68_07405 [Elusimicrobia bacterium]|nr:hypothetical protein [Candidatus Liberimonas magnetica]